MKDILKVIWNNEQALKENLLTTPEAEGLQKDLIEHIKREVTPTSLPGLRLRRMLTERLYLTWWTTTTGYPAEKPWEKIKPYLDLLEQFEAEKTIKKRLETEGLFVESRSRGEDQHLLIGKRDDGGEKAHIIIDGKTGEIRVEDNQQEPTQLVSKIETVLTLPSGRKIKTSREVLEGTEEEWE